ncbi:hypothetical protein BDN67DRAFT_378347 [Paxillus ammoniavirescens]|nr:hypothetical protein BDN67DRAFT_378347 [Paxillus ammoniavirescens]
MRFLDCPRDRPSKHEYMEEVSNLPRCPKSNLKHAILGWDHVHVLDHPANGGQYVGDNRCTSAIYFFVRYVALQSAFAARIFFNLRECDERIHHGESESGMSLDPLQYRPNSVGTSQSRVENSAL